MRVVQCHGCFDLLHIGHIRHFQAAKQAGDYLVVTVTPDRFVNKGPDRPVFGEQLRMEAIRALSCVDEVRLTESPTAADAIHELRPQVFAKGPDYSVANMDPGELDALADVGGRLLITETHKWSSTALLNPRPERSLAVQSYLSGLTAIPIDVLEWLDKARTLNVLVLGDAITDDYHYCNTLGKAGKEPILAAQYVRSEQFHGGVDAVAQHARACTDHVMSWSGPPVVKRRFIETYPFQKLFEIYEMDEASAGRSGDHLAGTLPIGDADLVIVADFGHGFLTPALVNRIQEQAKYLAVNVQANAGNHGFNTISKYPRADFISISERELRLDARDQTTDVRELMRCAASRRHGTVLVTRGAHGCMAAHDGEIVEAPALATHTVDRMGAGDAVFGVTACCAAVGMPLDLMCYVAAVVGTQAVGIVGNARYIERPALRSAVENWLR